MKITRAFVITGATAALTVSALAGLAPSASAVDSDTTATCSREARLALRQEIHDLHAQIDALRLTPQQIADAKAARQKAIADLRAQYGLPGATLTDAQRAELKAKIEALKADARAAASERRAKIDPLKAKIQADRTALQACRAGASGT